MAPIGRVSVLRRMTLGMKKRDQLQKEELKNAKEIFGQAVLEEFDEEEHRQEQEEASRREEQPHDDEPTPEQRRSNAKKDKYKSMLHDTTKEHKSTSRSRSRSPRRHTVATHHHHGRDRGDRSRSRSRSPMRNSTPSIMRNGDPSFKDVPKPHKSQRRLASRKQKPQRKASVKRLAKERSGGSGHHRDKSKRHSKGRSSQRTSITVSANDFQCETNELFTANYKYEDVLYEGEFCRIHSCKHLATGTSRVVKVVMESTSEGDPSTSSEDTARTMAMDESSAMFSAHMRDCPEFEVMRKIDSPFIPKVYRMYNQANHHMIVMERCYGNNLETELESHTDNGTLEEHHVKDIMWQLFSCLNYLHETAIVVHGDIRPCNMMLDQDHDFGKIKLIDFDAAVRLEDKEDKVRERRGGGNGQDIVYQAPEVHGSKPKYNSKADMWSCGVVMYQLLFGKLPFVESRKQMKKNEDDDNSAKFPPSIKKTEKDILRRMNRSKLHFPHADHVTKEVKDLIASLLHPKGKHRPTAAKVLRHKWFRRDNAKNTNGKGCPNAPPQFGPASDEAADPMAELDRLARLGNLRKHNPNSRLKQAVLQLMVADMLTKEEHAKINKAFQALDILHDGKLRRNEVRAGFLLAFSTPLTDDELDDIFVRCDSNRNGSLDYSEFAVASMSEKDLLTDDRLKRAFKRFDKHKRKRIGRAELQAVPAFSHCSRDQLDFIIAEVDLTGDGFVDFDNFVKLMRTGGVY